MSKLRVFLILIVIIVLMVTGFSIYKNNNNKNIETNEEEIKEDNGGIDEEVLALIDNSEYYVDKNKEYEERFNEYEDLVDKLANEKFTQEQKDSLAELNKKIMNEKDKDKFRSLKKEYRELKISYMNQDFSESELNQLATINEEITKLEPIVDEFYTKIQEAEDKLSTANLDKLEDGTIISKRDGILSEKEYDGIKFSEIELKYDVNSKTTTLRMKVENTTSEVKGNKILQINFEGKRTTGKYPFKLEEISPKECILIDLKMKDWNYSDTESFTISEYRDDENTYR